MNQKSFIHFAIPILTITLTVNIQSMIFQSDSTLENNKSADKNIRQKILPDDIDLFRYTNNNTSLFNLNTPLAIDPNTELLQKQFSSDYLFQNPLSEQWHINDELYKYIKYNKDLALKSDLGIFGETLGYSKTIAAFVLAILHVVKYRKRLYCFF